MFTNEIEFDETVTTIMDDDGAQEDVQIFIDDNEVFIRQYNERYNRYDLIVLSHKMYLELLESRKYPEGLYSTFLKKY